MMKFLINPGFARCGTTALHGYFANQKILSTPAQKKEIKAFLSPINIDSYLSHFNCLENNVYFESSPPYTCAGMDSFTSVLDNIQNTLLNNSNNEVFFIFNVRNPISRAFSHYWHEIDAHHSVFGKTWRIRTYDHQDRLAYPYERSFFDAIKNNNNNFLPPFGRMIKYAIECFGQDNIFIIHNSAIENGLRELVSRLSFLNRISKSKMPVTRGAYAPYYLYAGDQPAQYLIQTNKKCEFIEIPRNCALLISNRHTELLHNAQFDISRIVAASSIWSRSADSNAVYRMIKDYITEQVALLTNIPQKCFLGLEKDMILEEISSVPPDLQIKPATPSLKAIKDALAVIKPTNPVKTIIAK